MRKLLLITFLFFLTILSLVVVFRAILPGPQALQINAFDPLFEDPVIDTNLQKIIQLSIPFELPDSVFNAKIKQYISASFPRIDSNPNIEFIAIDSSVVAFKWIGRNETLAPDIWIHSPTTDPAPLQTIHKWEYDPMMGKILPPYIYGLGSSSEKMVLVAQLHAINQLIKEQFLTDRTVYLVYPKKIEELSMILKWFNINEPRISQILFSNVGIQKKEPFLNAYIGIQQSRIFKVNNVTKLQLSEDIANHSNVYKHIYHLISQKTSFSENLILRNGWLLGFMSQDILSKYIHLDRFLSKSIETNKKEGYIFSTDLSDDLSSYEGVIELLPFIHSSEIDQKYSQIERSIQQSFPNIQVYPTFFSLKASLEKAQKLSTHIYFFSPALLSHQSALPFEWINENVDRTHLYRSILFYYQFVKNCQN